MSLGYARSAQLRGAGSSSSGKTLTADRTPIAALRHEFGVSEALHQHGPGTRDMGGVPASGDRLAGKPVAWHRRDHDIERVRCTSAMGRWIRERIDDLQLLDDRAGPAMRDDERQRILMLRAD